jgi:hypothetical protein
MCTIENNTGSKLTLTTDIGDTGGKLTTDIVHMNHIFLEVYCDLGNTQFRSQKPGVFTR